MIGDLLLVLLMLIFSFTFASNHVVPQLFVGNYYKGYNGENIPATSSLLLNPMGGWSDSNGNFYIADQTRIRKVDTFGIMKTICGLTLSGVNFHLPPQPFGSWAIDETPATATTLSHVRSVWGDTLGNLFFIDGDRLRKVDVMTSNVTTMVGDRGLNHFTGENVTGTSTSLYGYFMTGDSAGNLYYSDSKYHRVRKFVKSTGRVLTIAGNGTNAYGGERIIATSTSINEPAGLVVDTSGNVFFIEQSSFRIRRVTKAGIMQTIVGTGFKCSETWDGLPGTSTDLCEPSSLYIDSLGNLFWVETDFNILRKFTRRTSLVSTLLDKYGSGYAGDGLNIISKISQILMNAQGVWSNSRGDLFIADGSNYRVRSIVNQIINTVAGNGLLSYGGDGGPATSAYIYTPSSVWGNTLGTVYFADMNNYRIRAISAAGIITTLGGTGKSGPFTADGTAFTSMSLSNIQTLSGDSYGNIYFFDGNRLRRYVISSSTVQTLAGTGDVGYNGNNVSASSVYFYYPNAMWVNTKGDVYITEPSQRVRLYKKATERVWDFAGNGLYQYSEDNVPATQTSLNPSGVWGDTEGNVFISDHANYRIRRVLLNGIITTFAGNGRKGWDDVNRISATSAAIGSPTSVSGDSLGNIYFSETSFCRILLVTSSGLDYSNAVVNTIFEASGCSSIYCPNANAIWIDSIGSIYTVEKSFNFIRKILYNTTSQSTMTVLPTYSPHSELKFVTSREGGVEREKSYPE